MGCDQRLLKNMVGRALSGKGSHVAAARVFQDWMARRLGPGLRIFHTRCFSSSTTSSIGRTGSELAERREAASSQARIR
jgi:hypothetical protein